MLKPAETLKPAEVMFSACLSICRDPNGVDSEEIAQSTDFNPQFEDSATGRRVDRQVEGRRTTSTVQVQVAAGRDGPFSLWSGAIGTILPQKSPEEQTAHGVRAPSGDQIVHGTGIVTCYTY